MVCDPGLFYTVFVKTQTIWLSMNKEYTQNQSYAQPKITIKVGKKRDSFRP